MARDFERRLARAETAANALGRVDAQAGRRRCSLRALVAVCDLVRERLVAMRIDPELAVALRRGEEPINLGNASLVELLAFVSAFGPIAQVDLAIDEMRRDDV